MGQSHRTGFAWILCIAIGIFLHIEGRDAACADKSFDSPCICLDDVLYKGGSLFSHRFSSEHDCLCTNGTEGTLDSIAKKCMKKNGRIGALYLSGSDITSLEPLLGVLKSVEHHLIVRNTRIESFTAINSLYYIGSFETAGNDRLSHIGLVNVSKVGGDLFVVKNKELSDISGLENLIEVNGNVRIEENGIENISGFGKISHVGSSLLIRRNPFLTNISGLSELAKVDGFVSINQNNRLVNLTGLRKLTSVGGSLTFSSNALSDITGISELSKVHGDVRIQSNDKIINISGLGQLNHVGGSVVIAHNGNLAEITGLSELTKVDGDVRIEYNDRLVNISGLVSLDQVGGYLIVLQNSRLTGLSNKLKMLGGLKICENEALSSLDWLQDLASIGGDVNISENPQLLTLDGFQSSLRFVNGSLAIANNKRLDLKALESVTHVKGDMIIEYRGSLFLQGDLNVTLIGGDLKINGIVMQIDEIFQNLKSVGHDLFISDSSIWSRTRVMPSLFSVQRHMTLSNTVVRSSDNFEHLKHIGGDLIIEGSQFANWRHPKATTFAMLPHVETVGGELDVNNNRFDKSFDGFDILSNLKSLCSSSANGMCGLRIRNNHGYGFIRGFKDLCAFSGFLSITGNSGLYGVTGFLKTASLTFSIVHAEEEVVSSGALGALVIAFNPDLRVVDGFKSLVGVEGDLFIFRNPQLDHLILENLMRVEGLTQIVENSAALKTVISTEPLPYSEPGCRSHHNTVPSFQFSNGNAFLTRLEYNECSVEKLVPMMMGIGTIATIIILSFLLFYYMFLSQGSSLANVQHITGRDLRNMFGVHVLALADVWSDVGFIVTAFIVWQGQDPEEKDQRVLIIGMLSTIVLVGSQFSMAILVYMGLVRKLPGYNVPLIEHLRGNDAMRRRDWLLLFPGLLALETEVIKRLPWGRSISPSNVAANGFPHKYFARVALMAVVLEDFPQIILQIAFTIVIEGSDGWAITGAIASLTLSMSDLIVKLAFPLLMKTKIAYHPIVERSPNV